MCVQIIFHQYIACAHILYVCVYNHINMHGHVFLLSSMFLNRQSDLQSIIWMKINNKLTGMKKVLYSCVLRDVKSVIRYVCVRKRVHVDNMSLSKCHAQVISGDIIPVNVLSVHVHECGKIHIYFLHRLSYDFNGTIWQVRAPCQS